MQKLLELELLLLYLVVVSSMIGCSENTGTSDDTELLSVVMLSRHGIRSPTETLDTINMYTLRQDGFPVWPAPADVPGNLSTVGEQNVAQLGGWYRDFYASRGVLPAKGSCPAAGTVFVYANNSERTIATARSYLDGMFLGESEPGCGFQVTHSSAPMDPYILPTMAGVCKVDTAKDKAELLDKMGGDPASMTTAYAAQLQMLQTVTQCCQPSACATNQNPTPDSCSLLDFPSVISVDEASGTVLFGPLFSIANSLTTAFQFQYAQGMPLTGCTTTRGAQCVGWGAIPPGGLDEMMKLHAMYMDLTCRLPSFAQAASSNLMWQLVGTLEQTVSGVKNAAILAPAESKLTLFVVHDINIAAIAAFLGDVTWKAEGFQQNDPSPAGALVFELHKVKKSGQHIVRLFFVTATLEQMRNRTELTLQAPPQRIPLTIPPCNGLDCPYEQLKTFITGNVRQDCLTTAVAP